MNTLFEDTSINEFVNTYTYGTLGYVKDNTGPTVIMLVGHTLMYGWVGKDVNVITDLHGHEILR
jgi:hypothetical protein